MPDSPFLLRCVNWAQEEVVTKEQKWVTRTLFYNGCMLIWKKNGRSVFVMGLNSLTELRQRTGPLPEALDILLPVA